MSKLTLDEAIKHCLEVVEKNEIDAITYKNCKEIKTNMYEKLLAEKVENDCRECVTNYRQLAEWLKELKSLRKKAEHLTEWNRKLIDYKNKIICKWGKSQEELQEAKRLLKLAVEDFAVYGALKDLSSEQRVQNPDWRRFNRVFDVLDHQWRYADEALKLLNDEKINNIFSEERTKLL